jgi:hypothetical protein
MESLSDQKHLADELLEQILSLGRLRQFGSSLVFEDVTKRGHARKLLPPDSSRDFPNVTWASLPLSIESFNCAEYILIEQDGSMPMLSRLTSLSVPYWVFNDLPLDGLSAVRQLSLRFPGAEDITSAWMSQLAAFPQLQVLRLLLSLSSLGLSFSPSSLCLLPSLSTRLRQAAPLVLIII